MTRAAILPHFGDPFALYYWLSWFKRVWHTEVDALYVVSSNVINDEVKQEIIAMLNEAALTFDSNPLKQKKIHYDISYKPIQHGDAVNLALGKCEEDLVMLVEEDTVIFKPGEVKQCFDALEKDYDIVASNRGSCSDILTQKSREKYGPCPLPAGSRDNCYNFWPNFFFCKKDLLLRTDRNFNARTWNKGERIEQLNVTAGDDPIVGDTFVWASIQLRALTTRIAHVEQYHGSPGDLDDYQLNLNVFNGRAGWVHHGSLSGWRSLLDEKQKKVEGVDPNEMARRMQWYRTFIDYWKGKKPDHLVELSCAYRDGIMRTMDLYGLSDTQIRKRQFIYQRLFGVQA